MKRILVATDFSAEANNACVYASELASAMNTSLTLFNAFHIPLPTSEAPTMMVSVDDIQKDANQNLEKLKTAIHTKKPELNLHMHSSAGFAVEEVTRYAHDHHMNMIVMGITGAGKIGEVLIGSTSTTLINKTNCPVLVVPPKAYYKKINKIVLACDFKETLNEQSLNILQELLKIYNSELLVLNVIKPNSIPDDKKAIEGVKIENQLSAIKHSLAFAEDADIAHGIEKFVDENKADLLIMVSRKHTIFDKLFHRSNTKKMAFHTHVPLLALHE